MGTTVLTRVVLEGGLERSRRLDSFSVGSLVGDQLRQVVSAAINLRRAA